MTRGDIATDPMTWAQVLRRSVRELSDAGVPGAMRDARLLLALTLGVARDRVTLILPDPAQPGDIAKFKALITRRCGREPVSHILGAREFYGREFAVSADVLDPRPDTETLIDVALKGAFSRVLDLGTGSGCILLTLLAENPDAVGLGSDISEPALNMARQNTENLGLSGRCRLVCSDWFGDVKGQFDLIVSNPPYITANEMATLEPEVLRFEPHMALSPGGDGLDAYRAITGGVMGHLASGGRLLVEIGPAQGQAVMALFHNAGLQNVKTIPDIDGRDRVVIGSRP